MPRKMISTLTLSILNSVYISLSLFFIYISHDLRLLLNKDSVYSEKILRSWLSIDHPVDGVARCFKHFFLLYHGYRPVFEVRANSTEVLSRRNIVLSFEDTKHEETRMPRLSGQRVRYTKR